MSVVRNIFLVVAAIAVAYFAPTLFPLIGGWFGASGFLAYAIGAVLVTGGLYALAYVTAPSQQGKQTSMEAGKVTARITEPPRWLTAGLARQGGGVLFGEFDASGNLWCVIVHSDSVLKSRIDYCFDDYLITVDVDGWVTTDAFCLNDKKEVYSGTGTKVPYYRLWTTTYDATDPTPPAIAALIAAFPGGEWTADHKLVGTTYTVLMAKALDIENRFKIYKWRGPLGLGEPSLSIIGLWTDAYDPRDEDQTLSMPATYGYCDENPVLIWAWFRTHRYGRRKSRDSINWDRVAEQASICDVDIVGIESTQRRYKCGISVPETKERAAAENEILMTMDAQLVFDDDGKCWPRVGHYEAPTLSLSRNRDIVAMESVEATNGESETQGVIVRYTSIDSNFAVQPAAAWLNPLYYVEGEAANFLTVDVLGCFNHNQAMRLAKAIGQRSQPSYKILPTVGLRGLRARQERIIGVNYDNTFAGDHEIVTPVEVSPDGIFCGFGAVPVDGNRWTLLPGEEKPKPVMADPAAPVAPASPVVNTSGIVNGRIEVNFDALPRDDLSYQFQYATVSDATAGKWSDARADGVEQFGYTDQISPEQSYVYRTRSVSSSGVPSDWSAPVDVGTVPMPPPTDVTALGGAGHVDLTFRNSSDIRFGYVRIYRGTTPVFGSAMPLSNDVAGAPSALQAVTDDNDGLNLFAGTYYYWFKAFDFSSAIESTAVGPISATVT